jgi:hypothetical protein
VAEDPEVRRAKNRERVRRWRAENGDLLNARQRQRYAEDPEYRARVIRESKDYYARNSGKANERKRSRYWENRDQENAGRRARRLRPGGKTPRERLRDEFIANLWLEQDGLCYLCEEAVALEDAILEHDHKCCPERYFCRFCIRGMSCEQCNLMIGHARDDPDRLERVARNLRVKLAEMEDRLASKPRQLELGEAAS